MVDDHHDDRHTPELDGWQEPLSEPDDLDADEVVALAVRSILATDGPLPEADLIDRLITDGVIGLDERDLTEDLLWDIPRLMPIRDGRLVHLPALAEGRTFTHRMTGAEIADQRLTCNPDLSLYVTFIPPLPLEGGGEAIERHWHDHTDQERLPSLFGPPGWLPDDLEAGDVVACRIDAGRLRVTRIDQNTLDPEATEHTAEHLRATYDALDGSNRVGGPIDEPELLLETVVRYPTVFRRPVPPIAELLAVTGLDEDLDDWAAPHAGADELQAAWFQRAYGLDEHGTDAVRILIGTAELFEREQREDLPADMADNLLQMLASDPAVAEALGDTHQGSLGSGAAGLARLVRLLRPYARGRVAGALALLEARVAEVFGDAAAGEAALRRAIQLDPNLEAAHEDLAWYLEDRGDGAAALRHLRLAGVREDDEQVQRLTDRQTVRPLVGRNDPCPCGSGAKFKKCCERTGGPLPDRIDALFDKISMYMSRPLQRAELMPLVEARAGDASDQERLIAAIGDPLVFDVALFEGEWLEDFLDDRGSLLPADERDLVATWIGAPRSLYEVVAVDPGEWLELLDLRSGERVTVREQRAGSTRLKTGDALFTRVVPDGVGFQLTTGVAPIPVQHREALLAFLDTSPSAAEICGWMAALAAPPTLATMEGEPTVFCTAQYAIDDPDQATAALRDRYEADPDGRVFVDWVEVDGNRWGRGTLEVDGTRLRITTNAEARLDRFKAVVEEVVAGATLLDESRRAAAELLAERQRGASDDPATGEAPGGLVDVDAMPDEFRQAVESHLRSYERSWVDESIPMFGGLTPRQALEDPTRREQLLAFLDEMEREEVPGSMSARRIRQLLGIGLL
ncbi:MAG: hypothetical protein EA388_00520 [Nitriliruptor sp.]|nr:MAG: hypothetical protein EA388_00520 [Nitriliruptor sp.]